MPLPSNAIQGQKSLAQKRKRLAREAKEEFANLPDWMFWNKEKMDKYLEKNTKGQAEISTLKEIGDFIRLTIRVLGYYEERE